jgi:hypothetical protein
MHDAPGASGHPEASFPIFPDGSIAALVPARRALSWALTDPTNTLPAEIIVAASDETTNLTTGTAKVTFRMPYAMHLTSVRGSLTTAQSAGSLLAFNVKEGGVTIFSTKPTFDNTEKTTTTAATLPVLSDTALADDAEITIDIDVVGTAGATGLKVTLIGDR